MDHLPDATVDIVNVLVLEMRDFVFSQVTEGLHCVEATAEVIKNNSEDFHQGHMVMLKNSPLTYTKFDVSALNPCALENQPILLFSM